MKKSDSIRCIRKYIKKDGTVSYHAEVRRKNAKPIRDSFRTLTRAKNWVRKVESSILEGKQVLDNKSRKYILSDLIERYINLHLSKFPQRLKDQITHLNWWKKNYGNKTLIEITPALLSEAKEMLLNGITSRKVNRSNATVNRYFSSLSRAFTLAFQEWQWINENPFRRVSKLKENSGRTRFLTREELRELLQSCKDSKNPNLYGMVLIAALLGMRFGEIANLKWKNIDFENKLITLEITKNRDIRVLPMPEQIYNFLQSKYQPNNNEGYIFLSKDPSKRHPYSIIRKAFQSVLNQLSLNDVVFHSLRHTAASHLAMSGATQGELMEILGHRSPLMTRRYAHFTKKHIASILQKTSNKLIDTPGAANES
ncbi:MAG: putative prophage phiRv2 integrase [Candidatus Anoxychlamydiales bacterium]|nr:putative prophage phiRv2 integrase [Candidatus Anoxychlamydiales bacterium]